MSEQRSILVVEDEPDVLFTVRTLLQISGYRVLEAATGEDALDILAREQPDVVLLDLRLPGISGWDVLETLRNRVAHAGLRVVLFSANLDSKSPARAKAYGCSGIVPKPFSPDELLTAIEEALAEAS